MKARTIAKQLYFALVGGPSRLQPRLLALAKSGTLTVLNLHRIEDRQNGPYTSLTPRMFNEWLTWLKTVFNIVTFAELGSHQSTGKPLLVLSFDDGYKDFVENVCPILKKHGLRANLNIIPYCVESGLPPMNGVLQDFITAAPAELLAKIDIPGLSHPIDYRHRRTSCLHASSALKNKPIAEQKAIFASLQPLFDDFNAFQTTPMMSIAEVQQVARDHEIGAHSFEHASMAFETDDYLIEDVDRCLTWFRAHLGQQTRIYAFPNGSLREGQADLVRRAGFQTMLTVDERFSRAEASVHARFTFYADSLAEARFRAVGGQCSLSSDQAE